MSDRQPPFDYARASALMDARGIGVLLVCSRANVGYLADYTYYVAQGLPMVMEDGKEWGFTFVGIPRDPALGAFITPVASEDGSITFADPWITDRRFWGPRWTHVGAASPTAEGPRADVAMCVADALRERGLEDGRIALELAAVPAAQYVRLRELLPRTEFVDSAPILSALRRVKSAAEIARLRKVAKATDAAIGAGYEALDAGCRETDFQRVMAGKLVAEGVSYGWSSIAYGPKGATLVEATERQPAPGEIIRVDCVGIYRGYYSDMSRVAAFARLPDDDARRAHAAILETNAVLRREMGPGVVCSELGRLGHKTLAAHGYPMLSPYAGHGIGRDVHETPYLADWDRTVLEPGMVLDVEPTVRVVGVGSVNIEDMVLVTEDGCEPLTSFPRDLLVFG